MRREHITITGRVQGVGFRPFVYRTAREHGVTGTVANTVDGVLIEAQGESRILDTFLLDLARKLPPLARVTSMKTRPLEVVEGEAEFTILKSDGGEGHAVLVSPDVSVCADCLRELRDPADRRHRYPFLNCTNCGPRYTITRDIPYDRPKTTMAGFPLCEACRAEYEDPMDRRFHAQPVACPACGPKVWYERGGETLAERDEAVVLAARELLEGKIIALKGLGGFHLACRADDPAVVDKLRRRKIRPHKPLAVMVMDMVAADELVDFTAEDRTWLTSMERPICLCKLRADAPLAPNVSPETDRLGLMLPYTPLHEVLFLTLFELAGSAVPLVMTSGNAGGEPICIANDEARKRLGEIADGLLLHDRVILIRTDDSVLQAMERDPGGLEPATLFFRRARGFTPAPVFLPEAGPCVFGTGPELKATCTFTKADTAFPSQHIGDLANLETLAFYREIAAHLASLLRVTPELVVRDLHPDYLTSAEAVELARDWGAELTSLQHHVAHGYAVAAEHKRLEPLLCLALDGTGYGEDGTLWGGEALLIDPGNARHERLAHIDPLPLPGGEAAIREPWRMARSYLTALGRAPGARAWPWLAAHEAADGMVAEQLARNLNCPVTTSMGRLFDAVAGLLGLVDSVSYEGQAAIRLMAAQDMDAEGAYPCPVSPDGDRLETLVLFHAVCESWAAGVPASTIARRFHLGLVQGLTDLALALEKRTGISAVGLSGGVLQNATIRRELFAALYEAELTPLAHTALPPNDGCISLGQAYFGQRFLQTKT